VQATIAFSVGWDRVPPCDRVRVFVTVPSKSRANGGAAAASDGALGRAQGANWRAARRLGTTPTTIVSAGRRFVAQPCPNRHRRRVPETARGLLEKLSHGGCHLGPIPIHTSKPHGVPGVRTSSCRASDRQYAGRCVLLPLYADCCALWLSCFWNSPRARNFGQLENPINPTPISMGRGRGRR
jgi:hypothetical protein